MGRPKLLLPWGDTTVIGHLIRQWTQVGAAQIAAVCSLNANPLEAELKRLDFPAAQCIFNATPEQGMFSSIQHAARWSGWWPELTHFAITLGDQPQVREATLRELVSFSATNADQICQPLRNGRRKHPVLMPRNTFRELGNTSAATFKEFLADRPGELAGFASDDAGLDSDLDTPEDYERVWRHNFGHA